jgi:hypothetical protein
MEYIDEMSVKPLNIIISLAAFATTLAVSCGGSGSSNDKPENPDDSGETTVSSALDKYWADDCSGSLGIQLGNLPTSSAKAGEPRMYLGGSLLYVTGMNCYNLFVQCHESDNMDTDQMEKTVKVLADEQVPIVRFSCSPFYANQMHYYTNQKEKYLANLSRLADLCDQNHILLIPSVFWNSGCIPEYLDEELSSWGDTNSKTYSFMISYTTDIVNVLKDHKCIAAWEFGNEFNLQADIASEGYPEISAAAVGTAYKGFAQTVKSLDLQGRIICSGNSVMRNAQWNRANNGTWTNDTFDQYREITGIFTPDPMNGMSEHIYEDARVFSDLGNVNLTYQLIYAKKVAASLGKVYYVGEFTGPATAVGDSVKVKKHYAAQYAQKIQLSLIWNYAYKGDIEYSFKAGTLNGDMAFELMRRYNNLFKKMKPE